MKPTLLHNLIKLCLAIIILGGGFLAYLAFLDGTVFNKVLIPQPNGYHFSTTKDTYKPGEDVFINVAQFCKLRPVPATIYWNLQDNVLLALPPRDTDIPVGCYPGQKQVKVGTLPVYLGVGTKNEYKFTGTIVYHVNGLRDVAIKMETNSFTVSALPLAAGKTIIIQSPTPAPDNNTPAIEPSQPTTPTAQPKGGITIPILNWHL